MRTVKVLLEEIDATEIEFQASALAAKDIFEVAKKANRELTAAESRTFDASATAAKHFKQKLTQLRSELQTAEQRDKEILGQSMNTNAMVYGNYGQPDRVLPTNGVLPSDNQRRYATHHRKGRLNVFRNDQEAFDAGMWYRSVLARVQNAHDPAAEAHCERVGLEVTNSSYEGSGPAGGYLVPPGIASTLIEVREKVGVARKVCRIVPTSGDTISIPKRAGGLTVYYPNELATITASDKSWSLVSLAVEKRAVASKISQELVDDALIDIVDNVFTEMVYALTLQEDNELINGTGASTYGHVQGLLSAIGAGGVSTAVTGHDTWAELDMADMTACVGKLPDRFFNYPVGWICSHSFFNQVMVRLAFAAGGVTASEIMGGTGNVRSFAGYPVYLTSQMPTATATATKCALFGAFDQAAILADRGEIRLAKSEHVEFLADTLTLRATQRHDIKVHEPGDASNAGGYVALATAS